MSMSKRNTLIAITVLAALSVEIGCGDGSKKAPLNKSLKTNVPVTKAAAKPGATASMTPEVGADGKPVMGADGKPVMVPTASKVTAPKVDPNLDLIDKKLDDLKAGTPITRDELTAGDYTLQSIVTNAKILQGMDSASVIQENTVNFANGGYTLSDAGNKLSGGMLTNFTDSTRKIDAVTKFSVVPTNGKWTPDRNTIGNALTLTDFVTTPKADGKPALNDAFAQPGDYKASILDILANGQLNSDKSYQAKDENNVPVYVRLIKNDAQNTMTVVMTLEEKRKANQDTTGTQSTSLDRSIFFRFNVVPKPVAAAANTPDTIVIKDATTGAVETTGQPANAADASTPAPTTN